MGTGFVNVKIRLVNRAKRLVPKQKTGDVIKDRHNKTLDTVWYPAGRAMEQGDSPDIAGVHERVAVNHKAGPQQIVVLHRSTPQAA